MSAKTKPRLTAEQYLRVDSHAQFKSEFVKGRIVPMPGGTHTRNRIKSNIDRFIANQLDNTSCQTFASDMRLKITGEEIYTYPDVFVVCGAIELEVGRKDVILNPRMVVEVLSPSTENRDRVAKFDLYIKVPSFVEYLLVSQHEPRVHRYLRRESGDWQIAVYDALEQVIEFGSIPVKLPLSDIYYRVDFEPDAEDESPAE